MLTVPACTDKPPPTTLAVLLVIMTSYKFMISPPPPMEQKFAMPPPCPSTDAVAAFNEATEFDMLIGLRAQMPPPNPPLLLRKTLPSMVADPLTV